MSTEAENLFEEASHALDRKQYAIAEKFQRQALALLESHSEDANRIAAEVEKLAAIHFQQAKFGLAASEYQRVLKLREASLPICDPQIFRVLLCLGKSYFNEMKYDLAEAAFRNALAASETEPDSSRAGQLNFFMNWVSCCTT